MCKMVDAELGYADSVPVFREGSKVCFGVQSTSIYLTTC